MPDMTDELNEIGAALADVVDVRRFSLTARQRSVLVQTPLADMLDAIVRHLPKPDVSDRESSRGDFLDLDVSPHDERHTVHTIASAWAAEWNAWLGDPETRGAIAEAFAGDNPVDDLGNIIEADDRLTTADRETVYRVLPLLEYAEEQAPNAPPSPAFLRSIAATGFRGIGKRAELLLEAGTGLTIVYGANGSGKSSFVEALEVLLTGNAERFQQRGPEWTAAWTNIHARDGGSVEVTVVSSGQSTNEINLSRPWKREAPWGAAEDEELNASLRRLGWLDAPETCRPILGYAELGSLLLEDARSSSWDEPNESLLARHVRLRTGDVGALLTSLLTGSYRSRVMSRHPFKGELSNWLTLDAAIECGMRLRNVRPHMESTPLSATIRRVGHTVQVQHSGPAVLKVSGSTGGPRRPRWKGTRRDSIAAQSLRGQLLDYFQDYPTPVGQVYADMILDVAYEASLRDFSDKVKRTWNRIRTGSAVSFEKLTILRAYAAQASKPTSRVSLDLTVDGIGGVERGVLSQGELHTLALSIFLPTMERDESPFSFAVIDDPTHGMDDSAIQGLAGVLRDSAKKLQVIVFTHDKRLLDALRQQGIGHTQINVTRTGKSVVTCEKVSDPISQRMDDAQMFAQEAVVNDEFRYRHLAAYQCRRAIEAACHRAVRSKFARQGLSHQQIASKVELALRNKDATTLRLLALAIFGDVGKQSSVRQYMKDHQEEWGKQQEIDTVAQVNALTHAVDLEAAVQFIVRTERNRHLKAPDAKRAEREAYIEREARTAFGRDPRDLIDHVEHLVKAIERNRA